MFEPRHGAEKARIDHAIHQLRLARQHVTEARRRTEHQGHQRDEFGLLAEQVISRPPR